MRKLLIVLGLLLISNLVLGEEFKILDVTNDQDEQDYEFIIKTNSKNQITHFYKDTYENSSFIERENFKVAEIENGGIVLERRLGQDVIKMFSKDFAPNKGANIEVQYLFNGVTGRRNSVFIKLRKDHNQFWNLYTKKEELISLMDITVNYKPFVGPIGIRSIDFE